MGVFSFRWKILKVLFKLLLSFDTVIKETVQYDGVLHNHLDSW